MVKCPQCGAGLQRARRRGFQRIINAQAYRCANCGTRVSEMRPFLRRNLTFVLSLHTHCIKCGRTDVQRRSTPDRIEPFTTHPISRLMFLTRAPVYRCATCRLQYYDWRPKLPES